MVRPGMWVSSGAVALALAFATVGCGGGSVSSAAGSSSCLPKIHRQIFTPFPTAPLHHLTAGPQRTRLLCRSKIARRYDESQASHQFWPPSPSHPPE